MHTATRLLNGKILLIAGRGSDTGGGEVYDPAAGSSTVCCNAQTGRYFHTASLLSDGRVLVTGGYDGENKPTRYAEVFDAGTNSYLLTASHMQKPRAWHTATVLLNGQVLIAGGTTGPTDHLVRMSELFDPSSRTFSLIHSMHYSRQRHTGSLLSDGNVVLIGGYKEHHPVSMNDSAEICDPYSLISCAPSAYMPTGRAQHTTTILQDGKILITGGNEGVGLSSALLYDLAAGFSPTGSLVTGRYNHTATLLQTGEVLVVGGYSSTGGGLLTSAELYNPATGTFSPTGSLNIGRHFHTATLLPDGRVMVAGGSGGGGVLNSVEIYTP